jgi:Ca-activated chloride channel homolog
MLELQHPWLLALALLLPLLWVRRLMPGGRARLAWPSLDRVRRRTSVRVLFAWLPGLLQVAALLLFIVALARPQRTNKEVVVESDGIDIVLAIDVSGSMEAADFALANHQVSRLEAAKAVVNDFVMAREHDRIGLVVFGEEAFTQVPLTLDHQSLSGFLGQVRIGIAGPDATAIGHAIIVASKRLADLEAPTKVIVLLTDGHDNVEGVTPLLAAQAADALGITIYTIGVGATRQPIGPGPLAFLTVRSPDAVDDVTLTEVAEATGGTYFRATDTRTLKDIYATIDELEKTTAEVTEYVHRDELFHLALLPGLACLLLSQLLGQTVLRRLP